MTLTDILPTLLAPNLFILFGLLLLVGLVAGELAHRTPLLPRITGFMALGLAIGPNGLNLLTPDLLEKTHIFLDMSLALILFDLGRNFHIRDLAPPSRLGLSALAESLLSALFIAGGLSLLGFPTMPALLAGAIGVSSSPAIVLMVVREFGAKGKVTDHALNLLAANNILSFMFYMLLLATLHIQQDIGWKLSLLHPLYLVAGSAGIAAALTLLGGLVVKLGLSHTTGRFSLLIALLMLGLGLSDMLRLSPLLTGLLFGVMVANFSPTKPIKEETLGGGAEMFFIILFVIAGAKLKLFALATSWPLALAFVTLRAAGKMLGIYLVNIGNKNFTLRQQTALGGTLTPMAGMAIGLITSIGTLYPDMGVDLVVIILASVAILETLGPLVTEAALKLSGDIKRSAKLAH